MKRRVGAYSCYVLMAASFVWLLFLTWFRWGNLLVDTFRDQWIFYKLSQGEVLYRDLYYEYGFLPPYAVSFFYKLFGVQMRWSVCVGIAVTALTVIFLYRIGRLFLNRLLSTMLALAFLFLFAFGNYVMGICNFIVPYSISSTFFSMFTIAGLYCFLKFFHTQRRSYLMGWALLLWCAFLSRIDYSCLVWAVYAAVGLSYLLSKKRIVDSLCIAFPPLAAALSYAVFITVNNAFDGFYESIVSFFSFVGSGKSIFSFVIAGFTDVSHNVRLVAVSFGAHIILLAFFYLLSAKMCVLREKYPRRITVFLTYVFAALCSVVTSYGVMIFLRYAHYRLLPVMLIVGMLWYLYRLFIRRDMPREKSAAPLLLFGVAFVLILLIVLKAGPFSYGFFLAVPSLACYYVFCFELYPSLLEGVLFAGRGVKKYYFLCGAVFMLVSAIPFLQFIPYLLQGKTVEINFAPRGKIRCIPGESVRRFQEVVSYVGHHVLPEETMVVFPEGVSINFMTGRDNPTRYHTFVPSLVAIIGEDNILRQLELHAIDYILITNRPTFEYGYPFFGIHYGRSIAQWIVDNYSLEKVIGPFPFTSQEFGAAIYKKKSKSAAAVAVSPE